MLLFENEYAQIWGLPQLVYNANQNQSISRGAHLLTHDGFKGEMFCRETAFNYVRNGNLFHTKNDSQLKYFASWNCEVSPFNIQHKQGYARPFIDDIKLLIWSLEFEDERRSQQIDSNILSLPIDPQPNERSFRPLLGISPSLWEQ